MEKIYVTYLYNPDVDQNILQEAFTKKENAKENLRLHKKYNCNRKGWRAFIKVFQEVKKVKKIKK